MPTIWSPFFSKRVMISPPSPRCTASGLRMMSVRSMCAVASGLGSRAGVYSGRRTHCHVGRRARTLSGRMGRCVAILEDTAARVVEMRKVLHVLLPSLEVITFDSAPDCVDWLPTCLQDAALICLDHDLGPTRDRAGARFDPGIGRDVVDVMAMYPAVCPVIVHSSNSLAVPGMLRVLRE